VKLRFTTGLRTTSLRRPGQHNPAAWSFNSLSARESTDKVSTLAEALLLPYKRVVGQIVGIEFQVCVHDYLHSHKRAKIYLPIESCDSW